MVDYFRYPDDILIVFDSTTTKIIELRKNFNNLHRNLNFNLEKEGKGKNKLYPHHHHYPERRSTIFSTQETTATDTITYNSCHPPKHKQAAINDLMKRIHSQEKNQITFRPSPHT
jgi:GTPase SAR1 family protein